MRLAKDLAENSEKRIQILASARLDFLTFFEKILGFEIAQHHIEWADLLEKNKYLSLISFRGSGKTTFISAYFIWLCWTQTNKSFLIVSNSYLQSQKVLEQIKLMITQTEVLAELIPKDRLDSWSKTEIDTTTKCKILTKSFNPNIRGLHVDGVLADEASLYQDHEVFFSTILPIIEFKKGFIIVTGTPLSKKDLLSKLETNVQFITKKFPALLNGVAMWPNRYSEADLERIKNTMDTSTQFEREYLLKILSSEEALFSEEIIEKASDEFDFMVMGGTRETNSYYIGADFAMSTDRHADYSVYIVLEEEKPIESETPQIPITKEKEKKGMGQIMKFLKTIKREDSERKRQFKIVWMERNKGLPFEEQMRKLSILFEKFPPEKIIVDEGNFGKAFYQELKAKGFPIEGFKFTNQNKKQMILELRNAVSQKKVLFPKSSDPYTKRMSNILRDELTHLVAKEIPGSINLKIESALGHDDSVMALGMALHSTKEQRKFLVSLHSF